MTTDQTANKAVIKHMGWKVSRGKKTFMATLVFPDGPPSLPLSVVWNGTPIRLVVEEPDNAA